MDGGDAAHADVRDAGHAAAADAEHVDRALVEVRVLEHQRRVVDHAGGPLLVLAGPGTGKTTTLVEAIVDRIETRGADQAQVLALTFSRKAAEQLRQDGFTGTVVLVGADPGDAQKTVAYNGRPVDVTFR